ncbi:uncharacterized protein JCM6883_001538 [Sporobolomyces salmoneus]|uniref:uncharacterized protein n=1 Tax=Sporobolomyces salmoneus TaxID=183962 RepID=UPI00317FB67A
MNGTTPNTTTSTARKHYNAASRSFLLRDYSSTASSLSLAFKSLPPSSPSSWSDALSQGTAIPAHVDLKRKLEILRITFLATVHSSPSPPLQSTASNLTPLLDLPPDQLIRSLWTALVEPEANELETDTEGGGEIVPSPRVSLVHPSIVTALCLAAVKLEEVKLARSMAEAWIGSTTEELERIVWEEIESIGPEEWETELPLDGMGTTSQGMNGSSILKPKIDGKEGSSEGRRQFVKSWIKLLDLLVLCISPRLEDWEAAGDFIRLQSVENGGWVPDQRVEATLNRLSRIRQDEINSIAAKAQRQKEIEAHKAAHKRETRSSSKQDKGKGRARDEHSPTSSSGSSPEKKKRSTRNGNGNGIPKNGSTTSSDPSSSSSSSSSSATSPTSALPPSLPSPSGFAGLRSSLTSYLSRSHPESATTTTTKPSSSNPITTIASYLRHHYSTDPLRLLSMICFFFALTTYLRGRFSINRGGGGARSKRSISLDFGMKNGMRLILGKVGETLKMGTKVTTL